MASKFSFLLLALVSTVFISTISIVHGGGFSVDLIHRDSPLSPFYNPSEKPFDRLRNAIERSANRINHFKKSSLVSVSSNDTIVSTMVPSGGEYLMKFSLGTPSHEVLAIADTGSDLIWTQCKPCTECYKQIAPIFDPKNSSTYKDVPCSSEFCFAARPTICKRDACKYLVAYGGGSHTRGSVAVDTFTFDSTSGQPVKFPNIAFGCGHHNTGSFDQHWAGLVGLGGGKISLISQLGSKIDSKFSYCLVPITSKSKTKASKLNFGSNAEISGEGVVSTPILQKQDITFYYLSLEGLSVDEKRINITQKSSNTTVNYLPDGNIIIDSGSTFTYLPTYLYEELESEVKKAVHLEPTTPPSKDLRLCYRVSDDNEIKLPTITVHFYKADVVLQSINVFVPAAEGVICLAFVPSDYGAIFGNVAQMNFLVEYDVGKRKVSFKPTDCEKGV